MNRNLLNKRLLILGGNPETKSLVEHANNLGIYTIVIDHVKNSPAKHSAKESYDIDVLNIELLFEKVKNLKLDGILVGVADILVPSYFKICEILNLPCYATLESIKVFSSKSNFINECEKLKIDVIPYYDINIKNFKKNIKKIQFPVLVKPVDNGAGVGMNISYNESDLKNHIDIALSNSKKKKFIVERLMKCDDMLVYYTISNGEIYLSAAADRFTLKSQGKGSPVCNIAIYPSKHLEQYIDKINNKIINLISKTKVQNGVLNIQFFVENGKFYAYDPGFRLQGEAPHLYLYDVNDFDNRSMLINFAVNSSYSENLKIKNDPFFKGYKALTLWVLLKKGKIKYIKGIDYIINNIDVINFIQRLNVGDKIDSNMIGTERQVFGRFYLKAKFIDELYMNVNFIRKNLKILNEENKSLIIDFINLKKINYEY